jgi:hypothetical protein
MQKKSFVASLLLTGLLLGARPFPSSADRNPQPAPVKLLRVPDGGIQPQAATDARGFLHLVYYSGDPFHGDLFYVRSTDAGETFSTPIRVNSQPGSAIAAGNIRGARLAIGVDGRVHVAWNGSSIAEPRTSDAKAPMLYTRLDATGRAFEPQRSLIHTATGIDGGGAIAADGSGHVYVFWHAPLSTGKKDEADRRVWMARSSDNGKTFEPERVAFDKPVGVCGCCGMNAFADSRGNVYALFRSATEMVHRDMYLLASRDRGETFQGAEIAKWNVGYCVMSSEAFAQGSAGPLAAWETEKQVYYAPVNAETEAPAPAISPAGQGVNRKYPALAANRNGQTLLVWTEGMAWKKGGSVVWQVFDAAGRPAGEPGRADGVPAWSLVAAFTAPDGSFRILY